MGTSSLGYELSWVRIVQIPFFCFDILKHHAHIILGFDFPHNYVGLFFLFFFFFRITLSSFGAVYRITSGIRLSLTISSFLSCGFVSYHFWIEAMSVITSGLGLCIFPLLGLACVIVARFMCNGAVGLVPIGPSILSFEFGFISTFKISIIIIWSRLVSDPHISQRRIKI